MHLIIEILYEPSDYKLLELFVLVVFIETRLFIDFVINAKSIPN